ncbi:MAG: stage II sporulation protein M [Maricaulaceae bacterium]
MTELILKSERFRAEREKDWRALESLLYKVETGGARALTDEEMIALPVLYRSALSSLSVARAISLDKSVTEYLEGLSTRAYFFVYGTRSTLMERIAQFFAVDWPSAVRAMWRETLASTFVTFIAAAVAFWLVVQDPDWFFSFVQEGMAQGRDPSASTESLRATLFDENAGAGDGLSIFATFLFTHNAGIAIFAMALGFAFCFPTALLLAYNGCVLGAFFALFWSRGLGVELGGWLLIHGVTELFAVILAGAAGFRIGWTLAFPGEETRLAAAARAGKEAGAVMAGVIVMLFCAALLEGFGRQLITSTTVRYTIAGATALLWAAYFYLPRSSRVGGARAGAAPGGGARG